MSMDMKKRRRGKYSSRVCQDVIKSLFLLPLSLFIMYSFVYQGRNNLVVLGFCLSVGSRHSDVSIIP